MDVCATASICAAYAYGVVNHRRGYMISLMNMRNNRHVVIAWYCRVMYLCYTNMIRLEHEGDAAMVNSSFCSIPHPDCNRKMASERNSLVIAFTC